MISCTNLIANRKVILFCNQKCKIFFCGRSTIRIVADSIVDAFSPSLSPTHTMADSNIVATQVPVPEEIPKYSLSRSLTPVAEVWMEYVHGIGTLLRTPCFLRSSILCLATRSQ
jgi:hypothetical protein